MIISISIYNIRFCIASIYGPNADDPSFFHTFFPLSVHANTTLIVGQAFNLVHNQDLDWSAAFCTWRQNQATGGLNSATAMLELMLDESVVQTTATDPGKGLFLKQPVVSLL